MKRQSGGRRRTAAPPLSLWLVRRRRKRLAVLAILVASVAAAVVLRWNGPLRPLHRFHRHTGEVLEVVDGRTLRVATAPEAGSVSVELLGVRRPTDHAAKWLADHSLGKRVTLVLEPPFHRGKAASIRAYVYRTSDGALLNAALLRKGLATHARNVPHPLAGHFEDLARQARGGDPAQ